MNHRRPASSAARQQGRKSKVRSNNWQTAAAISLITAILLMAGCGSRDTTVAPDGSVPRLSASSSSATAWPDTINGYEVRFQGRVYDGATTTFAYLVSGTGVPEEMTHFILGLPDCAPAVSAASPSNFVIATDPVTGLYGIDWEVKVGYNQNPGQLFSVTFPGDVPLGVVSAQVSRLEATIGTVSYFGPVRVLGTVPGPCAGAAISGFVYTDADSNGVRDPDELGIPDVTVCLEDAWGRIDTLRTDADGRYMFLAVDGTYTVRIDTATPGSDFNEDLATYFSPTGPTSRVVTVGPDSPFNDFGFNPNVGNITEALKSGDLTTTGRSVIWWRHEIRRAITGDGPTTYDAATLVSFLQQVQELALVTPYQFTPGRELEEALALLTVNPQDDEDLQDSRMKEKTPGTPGGGAGSDEAAALLRELLATELNHVAMRGLANLDFQLVLIAWGEGLVNSQPEALGPISSDPIIPLAGTSFTDATDMFKLLNGATGGGGTN
jgi:hypothetical protein